MFGGLLTEIGWRWVFLLPVPVALVTLLAGDAARARRRAARRARRGRFDVAGAVSADGRHAAARLHARAGARPRLGLAAHARVARRASAALLPAFVWHEQRAPAPLVRLGIFRPATLVRANLGAMSLIGGWIGFQFVATLYMQ